MAAEGAENKYNAAQGGHDVPEKLSLGDFDKTHHTGADADPTMLGAGLEQHDPQRDAMVKKTDGAVASTAGGETVATPEPAPTAAETETKSEPKLDLASRLDPTKPMALLKLFGDLIITHEANTQMPDTRTDLAKAKADAGDDEHSETYNGNEKTQEAFASVAKVVPRDSEIPDRLLQTLDRLSRQMPNSQIA